MTDGIEDSTERHTRIRLLFVIRALSCGGAERQLIELVKGIDKKRFDVTVATLYGGGALESEISESSGVTLLSLGKKGRWDLAGLLMRFSRLVREVRPDVTHGYMGFSNELSLLARALCGSRAIWGIRGSACDYSCYNDWGRNISYWMERLLSRFADCIIVNSESGRKEHIAEGFEGARMKVIRNGIDADRFHPDRDAGKEVRREWGIAPEAPVIGIVARLDPMKDHPTFLHAAALLARHRPEVRFVCVGDGPLANLTRLQALTAELGLEGRLQWHPARRNVTAVYNALTILTSSSLFGEGFSNAIGEAMACGIPVVATDVGDAAFIVNDCTRVVPPGCPERLVTAWKNLLDQDKAVLARRAAEARERIVSNFSMTQLACNTEAALLDTLKCQR